MLRKFPIVLAVFYPSLLSRPILATLKVATADIATLGIGGWHSGGWNGGGWGWDWGLRLRLGLGPRMGLGLALEPARFSEPPMMAPSRTNIYALTGLRN